MAVPSAGVASVISGPVVSGAVVSGAVATVIVTVTRSVLPAASVTVSTASYLPASV